MTQSAFVSTQWLQDHLGDSDLVVVDGSWYLASMNRDPQAEYLAGHIPGALRFDIDTVRDHTSSLPHMLPSPQDFATAVGAMGIGNGSTVVIYDGAGLFSAPRVLWTFRTFGVTNAFILEGGFPAWKAEGRPVETGAARPRTTKVFTPLFDASAVADRGAVHSAIGSGSAQVVDARPADRFRGEAPEPRPGVRSGHIPGSFNMPSSEVVADGRLKGPEEIRQAMAKAGIDAEKPVVSSCGSGVTAAIVALALESAGTPVKSIYDGSWADWGAEGGFEKVATGPAKPER